MEVAGGKGLDYLPDLAAGLQFHKKTAYKGVHPDILLASQFQHVLYSPPLLFSTTLLQTHFSSCVLNHTIPTHTARNLMVLINSSLSAPPTSNWPPSPKDIHHLAFTPSFDYLLDGYNKPLIWFSDPHVFLTLIHPPHHTQSDLSKRQMRVHHSPVNGSPQSPQ